MTGFGIKKLQINLVIEDEKISLDELQEQIAEDEDHVQSTDVAAMQKLYGADTSYHVGSDTYTLPGVNAAGTVNTSAPACSSARYISGKRRS